jgi:hypothetical protein
MKYTYRCASRFPVLIMINDELVTIRPNQVIESTEEITYDILKLVKDTSKKTRIPKKNKEEVKNGNNSRS